MGSELVVSYGVSNMKTGDRKIASYSVTDESRFGLHPDSRRTGIRRRPGNAERLSNVQEVHKFQGGYIMVCGGIMMNRKQSSFWLEERGQLIIMK